MAIDPTDRFEFLRRDIELCFTFIELSSTELRFGERDAAKALHTRAEEGYATIIRLLNNLRTDEQRVDIEQKLHDLRTKLDSSSAMLAESEL